MVFFFFSNFKRAFCEHRAASDQGLHCLPMPHKKDARHIFYAIFITNSILYKKYKLCYMSAYALFH